MKKRLLSGLAVAGLAGALFAPTALAHTGNGNGADQWKDGCPNSPHSPRSTDERAYVAKTPSGSAHTGWQVTGLDGRADNGGWAEVGVKPGTLTTDPDFYVVANNPSPQEPTNGVRQACVSDETVDALT